MKDLGFQIKVTRDLGRSFKLSTIGTASSDVANAIAGTYKNEAEIKLNAVSLRFIALDSDLKLKENEPADKAGGNILRTSTVNTSPVYPALVVVEGPSLAVSFSGKEGIIIGRGRSATFRVDNPAISAKHAKVGIEDGKFYVEDLGSTNGTFVKGKQIAGKVYIDPATPIVLGKDLSVAPIQSEEQLVKVKKSNIVQAKPIEEIEHRYPVLVSVSEAARPARLVLKVGERVRIGRDPASEIWVGVPHVSREQCSIVLDPSGIVRVTDGSKNGISYEEGILRRGETLEIENQPRVLDFGGGITLAICFTEQEETKFTEERGAAHTFLSAPPQRGGVIGEVVRRATNHTALNLDQIHKVNRRVFYSLIEGFNSWPLISKVGFGLLLACFALIVILLILLLFKQLM